MDKLFNRRNKKGFTLTELIIVIAILAILAAILVPLMVGYLDEAKQAVADANARTLYSAAAAAATIIIADGGTPATCSNGGTTDFAAKITDLVGDNFTGVWTVTVDGEDISTEWRAAAGDTVVGEYPAD